MGEVQRFHIVSLMPDKNNILFLQKTYRLTAGGRCARRGRCVSRRILLPCLCFLHYRVCSKMSGSNMELDRCSQQGSVESPAPSPRGLGSVSLPTASTDNLAADTGKNRSHSYFRQVVQIRLLH